MILGAAVSLSAADRGVTLVGTGLIPGDALDRPVWRDADLPARESRRLHRSGHAGRLRFRADLHRTRQRVPRRPRPRTVRRTHRRARISIASTSCISRSTGRRVPEHPHHPARHALPDEPNGIAASSATPMRSTPCNLADAGASIPRVSRSARTGPSSSRTSTARRILEFNRQGHRLRRIPVPATFLLAPRPAAIPAATWTRPATRSSLSRRST